MGLLDNKNNEDGIDGIREGDCSCQNRGGKENCDCKNRTDTVGCLCQNRGIVKETEIMSIEEKLYILSKAVELILLEIQDIKKILGK